MFVAATALSMLLALMFGAGAIGKLTMARNQVETASKLKISWRRYRVLAFPEAAAAVGLVGGVGVAPLGIAAAVGLVALMAGAISFRLRAHDALPFILGDSAVLLVAGVTAALRALSG